jgi:hypothetical protein
VWMLLKKLSYLVFGNHWVLYNRKYLNLIINFVNVKNFVIVAINDLRYEAVFMFKYLCTYVYIYNLIRSCDWLYIYVPFRKQTLEWNYDLGISALKNVAFSANLSLI